MSFEITKKDIIWGYFAQFFSISSGVIVLPLILKMLSSDEIGMNYLMLSVGAFVTLFDFGFAPQLGRNITYVFGGAQSLQKEGITIPNQELNKREVNYHLLATMIQTSKIIYRILSFIVLVVMLSLGTLYLYKVTNGFTLIDNALVIWLIYSIAVFFNMYFLYYNPLLTGKGLIKESRKVIVYSKICYIILSYVFLLCELGLFGVVLANFISPFVSRVLSRRYFFSNLLKNKINHIKVSSQEKRELVKIIWYNSKKIGLVSIGGFCITRSGTFIAGLFLTLSEIASYGLMVQLMGVIISISNTLFNMYQPRFSYWRIQNDKSQLMKDFSLTMGFFYLLFFIGSLFLILIIPFLLKIMMIETILPITPFLILYSITSLLESNHSNFATFIATSNSIPYVKSSLIAGFLIILGNLIFLGYFSLGILGLILVPGIIQLCYANWKWPKVVFKDFEINLFKFIMNCFSQINLYIRKILR